MKNLSSNISSEKYIIVFDFDETLGCFGQLGYFWYYTKKYLKTPDLDHIIFFKLLDSFEKFLRPNIIKLLNNIKNKKKKGVCDYVIIYTNNFIREWSIIIEYFHYK